MSSTNLLPLSTDTRTDTKDGWTKIEYKTMISHLKDHAILIQRRDGYHWFKSIPISELTCPMEGDITIVGEEHL